MRSQQQIEAEIAKLEKQYMKKMKSLSPMVPPAIRADVLNGIAAKMDKLESQICIYYKNIDRGIECTAENCPCDLYVMRGIFKDRSGEPF